MRSYLVTLIKVGGRLDAGLSEIVGICICLVDCIDVE